MVRRPGRVKRKIVNGCLEILRGLDRFEVEFAPEKGKDHDGVLHLCGPGLRVSYTVQIKHIITHPMLPVLLHELDKLRPKQRPALLFTDYVNERLGESLRKEHVEFVDLSGNMYLNQPQLYVYVTGRKRTQRHHRPTTAFQPSGLKLVFLLLKRPDAIDWNYRKIAQTAEIGLGTVGRVIRDLRSWGFVRLIGHRKRQLVKQLNLLERWDTGYAERLRPQLLQKRYRIGGGKGIRDLTDRIHRTDAPGTILIGGELGASLLVGDLRPERATLHLLGEPLQGIAQLRLVPDLGGPIDVVDAFGPFTRWEEKGPEGCTLADPLLIRSELILHRSERNHKIAERIYTEYITTRMRGHDQP